MWNSVKMLARRLLGSLSVLTFAVLVGVILIGVFSRHVLNDQVRWSEELARLLLVWISFLGGALAYIDDKHLGVEVLVARLDPTAARIASLFCHIVVFLFALFVMGIGGSELVAGRFDSGQLIPALQINKGWVYIAVPISGYLIALFGLGNLITFFVSDSKPSTEQETS